MRGTWIARIYQPVFPALVVFCARWFAALPPLAFRAKLSLATAAAAFADFDDKCLNQNAIPKNGARDGTRTRDLCRDRAAL